MKNDTASADHQDVVEQIYAYFPDCKVEGEGADFKAKDGSELLIGPEQILPYLQTILFEEHLVEIQLDFTTRLFFANILDDIPAIPEESIEGEMLVQEIDYEKGSYLKNYSSIVMTPLTPGMGNVKIASCKQVIVRFFTGTNAIELGTVFLKKETLHGNPVLHLGYPKIGRVNRSYRPFRVKAVSTIEAKISVNSDSMSGEKKSYYQIVDISAMGIAFNMNIEEPSFVNNDHISMNIQVPDIENLQLAGNVRHISKVRSKKGVQTIVGVQFDLATRSIAADIEKLVAAIQRLQLREMVDRTASLSGVQLIK